MGITADNREALAHAIRDRRARRFGTKKAAYTAADVNSGTWDKAEDPEQIESVRDDLLRRIVLAVEPASAGEWAYLLDPLAGWEEHRQRNIERTLLNTFVVNQTLEKVELRLTELLDEVRLVLARSAAAPSDAQPGPFDEDLDALPDERDDDPPIPGRSNLRAARRDNDPGPVLHGDPDGLDAWLGDGDPSAEG